MFILSLRCSNLKKKLLLGFGAVAVCAALVVCSGLLGKGETVAAVSETSNNIKTLKAGSNEDRVTFLKAFGWDLKTEAEEVVDVAIPKEFGDIYLNYNEIQKLQGFDLFKFRGKMVKRYTYVVLNYPGHPENIRANLLILKGKIIGGDICSLEAANGFMHGFALEESPSN